MFIKKLIEEINFKDERDTSLISKILQKGFISLHFLILLSISVRIIVFKQNVMKTIPEMIICLVVFTYFYLFNLIANGVNFDIIGLSFYPWWHGTLSQVRSNLNDLSVRCKKDLIIAEYAYPWTLQWFDSKNNIVGSQ